MEIATKKCQSPFICQTLSESLVKSNLFFHSCAQQGTQTQQNLIFAQDIAKKLTFVTLFFRFPKTIDICYFIFSFSNLLGGALREPPSNHVKDEIRRRNQLPKLNIS